jgi:hypothetical protein
MRAVEPMLKDIYAGYRSDPDLIRVVLNATSWVEANLGVELLSESVPARTLVTFANVREALKELPRCPMGMAIDFEGLARVWELEREGHAWVRDFEDPAGDYSVVLLGEGNHLYDIVIRADGRTLMWMPECSEDDFLNPDVIDLVMERATMLDNVIGLVQAMGLPFNPMFYMSVEDWRQEYAQVVFDEVLDGFCLEDERRTARAEPVETDPHGTRIKFRGVSDDGGLAWLI